MRWTRPESWHLTLLFLGSIDPSRVPELETLVDRAAAARTPYDIELELGGGHLRRGEGVAWLGANEGAGRLITLATDIADACPAGISAGPPPKRTPSAHLTVARKADEAVIAALRTVAHGPVGVAWVIDRICLVRSHLEPDGARYATLHEATM